MNRESNAEKTSILQLIGINHYARWYLPFWAWCLGFFASFTLIVPAMFWCDIFTVENVVL